MMKSAFRIIKNQDRGTLAAYTFAFEELARELGLTSIVEPLYYHLNEDYWFRTVRVFAESQETLSPFKELLDSPVDKIYDYLRERREIHLEERRKRNAWINE